METNNYQFEDTLPVQKGGKKSRKKLPIFLRKMELSMKTTEKRVLLVFLSNISVKCEREQ